MRYRTVEQYYELALDDSGTKIIDLKTTDPLSAIRLEFKGTNGGTSNKSNLMDDVITKIEIVDGSDQLLSVNLKQAHSLQWFNTKKTPFIRIEERGGGSIREEALLLFGRYLWDPEYYLDLTQFTNPQLKITTDEDAIRDMGATGFLTTTFKVTVNLHVIEEGAQPSKGFMMSKEVYSFTSGTSGDEHIDLPLDYPYANLILRSYVAGNDLNENISALKISCDAGKFIPIDKKCGDILTMNEEDYGIQEIRAQLFRKDAETVYHIINKEPVAVLIPDQTLCVMRLIYQWSGSFQLTVQDIDGTAITSERWLRAIIQGNGLHSCLCVPFGLLSEPDSYFNPKDWNDIELVLTQAAAAETQIVLQQLRTYAA